MDLEEEDDYALEVESRMKAPLVWDSPANCKIQDLQEPQYDEALRLIKRHYFREDPMCKASSLLQDQSSVKEYMGIIRTWMKETTSLIAASAASGRVIGVAISRINSDADKTDTYDRVQISKGKTLQKIMLLRNTLVKETNAYEKFGHDKHIRIDILCVHPSYQEKGVDIALLDASMQVAITLKMPAIAGIFTSGDTQAKAETVGFEILWEIRYSQWIVDDRVVFDDPGRGNYTAAFMGKLVSVQEEKNDDEDGGDGDDVK